MDLPRAAARTAVRRIRNFIGQDAGELSYAATVSIRVRWACLAGALIESSCRVEYGAMPEALGAQGRRR